LRRKNHALAGIGGVGALRVLLDEQLKGLERLACFVRRALGDVRLELALEPVGPGLEIYEATHVVSIVDARMRRVFADELVRLVDRRIGGPVLVVGVDQVELALLGLFAERVAGLEHLVALDGARVVVALMSRIASRYSCSGEPSMTLSPLSLSQNLRLLQPPVASRAKASRAEASKRREKAAAMRESWVKPCGRA